MMTAQQLARRKQAPVVAPSNALQGEYDHEKQRRWIGEDASLIEWTMKSDTSFDRESRDPD
jgi:hypothetical protein